MDPINSLSRIMEMLRRRELSQPERPGLKKNTPNKTGHSQSAPKTSLQQLEQQITARIKKLPPDEPGTTHKAAGIFIESVLAWEFGQELLQDRRFSEIIKKVETMIEHDPQLKNEMEYFLSHLQ